MSQEHYREEARRWLQQARADLRAARISLAGGAFEWACFQAQQAGEKSLKALWYFHGEDPWGHSLVKLLREFPLPEPRASLDGQRENARLLDKLYVPTRYPNGLPDLTPAEVYAEPDARAALEASENMIDAIAALLAPS